MLIRLSLTSRFFFLVLFAFLHAGCLQTEGVYLVKTLDKCPTSDMKFSEKLDVEIGNDKYLLNLIQKVDSIRYGCQNYGTIYIRSHSIPDFLSEIFKNKKEYKSNLSFKFMKNKDSCKMLYFTDAIKISGNSDIVKNQIEFDINLIERSYFKQLKFTPSQKPIELLRLTQVAIPVCQ